MRVVAILLLAELIFHGLNDLFESHDVGETLAPSPQVSGLGTALGNEATQRSAACPTDHQRPHGSHETLLSHAL